MTPMDLFKAGQLQQALDGQIQAVKSKPADPLQRIFLFELLCFTGDLDRAQRQIEAVQFDDFPRDAGVAGYRQLLDAERARRQFFQSGEPPKFLISPPDHVHLRIEAVGCLRDGKVSEAGDLLARADQAASPFKGKLNDKEFDKLRDYDEVFGPVIEVMFNGEYYWVALEQMNVLAVTAPKYPRDQLWLSAHLDIRDGPTGAVFLPALYPGTHENPNDEIRRGRLTDWTDPEQGPIRGMGTHLYLCGEEPISLLDWRQLQVYP